MRHGGSEGPQATPGRQGLLSSVPDTAGCRHRSRIAVPGLEAGYPWGRATAGGQDGDRSENRTRTPSLQQSLPEWPASPRAVPRRPCLSLSGCPFREPRAGLAGIPVSPPQPFVQEMEGQCARSHGLGPRAQSHGCSVVLPSASQASSGPCARPCLHRTLPRASRWSSGAGTWCGQSRWPRSTVKRPSGTWQVSPAPFLSLPIRRA